MSIVCGIDEAGRGPLAGPVTAGAVVLPRDFPVYILDDSKRLSPQKRTAAAAHIMRHAAAWGVGWAWPEEIDRMNILNAALLAMTRAFAEITQAVHEVLVDGNRAPELPVACRAVVGGDGLIPEIMAASILAKTCRDRWMTRFSWIYPEYHFDQHKGYPTALHRAMCARYGPCPIHRRSFRITPVE